MDCYLLTSAQTLMVWTVIF